MGPIGDYIASEEFHPMISQSFVTSYLVHSGEEVTILHEVVAVHGEPHPYIFTLESLHI